MSTSGSRYPLFARWHWVIKRFGLTSAKNHSQARPDKLNSLEPDSLDDVLQSLKIGRGTAFLIEAAGGALTPSTHTPVSSS
jgi:hypothetical protein